MIDYKRKIQKILSHHRGIPFMFSYWDGASEQFGTGSPRFIIHFKTREAFRRSMLKPDLCFGEAYARGDVIVEGASPRPATESLLVPSPGNNS